MKTKKKVKILLWIVSLILSLLILILFYYFYERDNKNAILYPYKQVWRYSIWLKEEFWWIWEVWYAYNSICINDTSNCLRWDTKGIKVILETIYVYSLPKNYTIGEIDWWDLLFENSDYFSSVSDISNARVFWILTQDSMNFYSLNELETLPEEQKNILLDLKENPRFIFE